MKAKIFSLCALAAAVGLTSCNQNNGTDNGGDFRDIVLSSGVSVSTKAPSTKAPVETSATVYVAGWETADEATLPVYATAAPTWISTAVVPVQTAAASISLAPSRQYQGSDWTHMVGWYPAGTNLNTADGNALAFNGYDGSVTFATDGNATDTIDVLYASRIAGNVDNPVAGPKAQDVKPLVFNHMTTQVKFKATMVEDNLPTVVLKSVTVKNAHGPIKLALEDGEVTWNMAAQTFSLVEGNGDTVTTVNAAAAAADVVGRPSMVKPVTAENVNTDALSIDAVVMIGDEQVTLEDCKLTVDKSSVLEAGHAYTFLLKISQTGISLEGHIVPWVEEAGDDIDLF